MNLFLLAQISRRENCGQADENKASCLSALPEVNADQGQISNGLSIIFAAFAAVAIIVIIIAAINFATSEGNPENISKSKKTIIYALVGLVISLSAEAAVLTVLDKL